MEFYKKNAFYAISKLISYIFFSQLLNNTNQDYILNFVSDFNEFIHCDIPLNIILLD